MASPFKGCRTRQDASPCDNFAESLHAGIALRDKSEYGDSTVLHVSPRIAT